MERTDLSRPDANVSIATEVEARNNSPPGTTKQQHFRFLDLPPELRNRIYSLVLHENDTIEVSAALRPPPLLATSRTIRKEATGIWYHSNKFHFNTLNCDVSLYRAFYLHAARVGASLSHDNITMDLAGCNWANLLRWCYMVWTGECSPIKPINPNAQILAVVYAAKVIAAHSRTGSWEDCKFQLEAFRMVAEKLNVGWSA